MKAKKIIIAVISMALLCSVSLFGLTGCGGLEPPSDFKFTLATREYSFKTASGADTYQITIEKILNEPTGKSLVEGATIRREEKGQTITQPADMAASLITMPGSDKGSYVWSSTINNTMSIKDTAGTGEISGKLSIYQFQSKADGVTPVLLDPSDPTNPDEIPLGHYYISCYSLDKEGNRSDPTWQEFVVGGKLEAPKFSYTVENGKMTVSIDSSYINSALRTEGLPYSVDVEIDDGSGTKKTVSFDDWAYYTTVIGPETSFNFMFLEKDIDVAASDSYTVKAVAKGDGDLIKDSDTVSLANHRTASAVPADWFGKDASTVELTAKTDDGMTIGMSVDNVGKKWALEGYISSGSVKKYYGETWGTFAVGEDGAYVLTTVGGGDYATVTDFAIIEFDGDAIKKASAKVTVTGTSVVGKTASATLSYEKRQNGGWGPPPV